MLALLPLLAAGNHGGGHGTTGEHAASWVEGLPGWGQTLAVLGAVAAIVIAGRYLMRPVFRFIAGARLQEVFTAAALLLVIGIALLMSWVGLSPALGAFLAGVVLAGSEYRHELETDIEPFKGLLLGLFFIAVGASIDFDLIAASPGTIAGLVAMLVAVKLVVLFALGRVFKIGLDQNLLFSFSLAQTGEFAFVLFSFATQNGVLSQEVAGPLVAVVALSMALTPLLMLINEKLLQPRFGTKESGEREADVIDEDNPVIIAGFGRFGHIVGRFLTANGCGTTVLEHDSDHIDLLRKLGIKAFYGDASRHDLLVAAGAQKAELLVLAIDDREKTRQIVETCKKHFPNLEILARAYGRYDEYELLDAGVEHTYRETLESSLRMGVDAMRLLGHRSYEARRAANKFRKLDEETVRMLAGMRKDRKAYIRTARQRIKDMEEVMQSEIEDAVADRDAAWDTTTLRKEFGGS